MRRLSFVISAALLLAGGINPLLAQRHSDGHHAGSQPGYSHAHAASSNPYTNTGDFIYPTPLELQPKFAGYTGINLGAYPTASRGDNRQRGYLSGYFAAPYYYSGFENSNTPQNYNSQDQVLQDQASQAASLLGDQLAQLSREVSALRKERESAAATQPMQPLVGAPATAPLDTAPPPPPLTLVLRNGKQIQLKSYAIVGQDIWDFSSQTAKKIAPGTVDLNASRSATEANGGEFPDLH